MKYKILIGLVAVATVFNRFMWAELEPRIEQFIYQADMFLLAGAVIYTLVLVGRMWADFEKFKTDNNNKFIKSLKGANSNKAGMKYEVTK